MKHVRLRITADGREAEIHPMYDLLANAPFVEYATAMQWNFIGDELDMLHFVEGDRTAFEDQLENIPEVVGYETETAGAEAFYTFVRAETTPAIRQLWDVTLERALVSLPPVEYNPNGTVTFSMFGPSEMIQAAIDTVPEPVAAVATEDEVRDVADQIIGKVTSYCSTKRAPIRRR